MFSASALARSNAITWETTMNKPVRFRLVMDEPFFNLPAAQRRRMCRCIKEVWIDIVGPNPRHARGFFARLFHFGRLTWRAPTIKHVSRLRRALRRMLAPGYVLTIR
jgi:hypothetical protein